MGYGRIILALGLLSFLSVAAAEPDSLLSLVYTAETHAALLPCECPLEPLGGVARRATALQQVRAAGPTLALDGGGWGAGSLYDLNSNGDAERDRLRTNLMARALRLLDYELVALPADLAVRDPAWKAFAHERGLAPNGPVSAWKILKRGGLTVAVRLLDHAPHAELLQAVAQDADEAQAADLRVGIVRGGEDAAEALARDTRAFDLLFIAGKKQSTRQTWTVNGARLVNFDFEARRLIQVDVLPGSNGQRFQYRVTQTALGPKLADAPEVAALLEPHLSTLKQVTAPKLELEYWTMGHCPACVVFLPELNAVAAALGDKLRLRPRFLVNLDAEGNLTSLHGPAELHESKIQALIGKYYPERFLAWAEWRKAHPDAPWEDGARALGLLRARLAGGLATGEAEALLKEDFEVARRRRIAGTPTLVVANRVYEGEYTRLKILSQLCALLQDRPDACKEVPACFHNAECRKRGFVGRCLDAGKPEARCDFSQEAVAAPVAVLVDPDALWASQEELLNTLVTFLPGMQPREVDLASEEGQRLARDWRIERAPAYLLGPEAKQSHAWQDLLPVVEARAGGFLLKDRPGGHIVLSQPRLKGRAELYVSRYSRRGQEALEAALAYLESGGPKPDLRLYDAVYWSQSPVKPGEKPALACREGLPELEEVARGWALQAVAPDRWHAYVRARGKHFRSSYWDRALEEAGLSAEQIQRVRALAEGPAPPVLARMEATADALKALDAAGDIVLVGEGRELLPVASARDLQYYLELIGRNRTATPGE